MLLIQRRRGEGFQVGQDIHIAVLGVEHGTVRIGITAPKDVSIMRDELVARAARKVSGSDSAGDETETLVVEVSDASSNS